MSIHFLAVSGGIEKFDFLLKKTAAETIYSQYRCGLVHSGVTLQFSEAFSTRNDRQSIYVISCKFKTVLYKSRHAIHLNPTILLELVLKCINRVSKGKEFEIGAGLREKIENEIEMSIHGNREDCDVRRRTG